jgi:hypothetical protein
VNTHADSLRALAKSYLAAPFGGALLREKLQAALAGDESLQLTVQLDNDRPAAFVMVEHVAGGHGTWRLHVVCGAEELCADSIERALADTWAHGGRLAVAELPDDAEFEPVARQLRASGFHEAGRVANFFSDGVGLLILTRDIAPQDGGAESAGRERAART